MNQSIVIKQNEEVYRPRNARIHFLQKQICLSFFDHCFNLLTLSSNKAVWLNCVQGRTQNCFTPVQACELVERGNLHYEKNDGFLLIKISPMLLRLYWQ